MLLATWNGYQYAMMVFYFVISLPIFNQIYETSQQVIDEEFHLRQGLHYCDGNFSVWDPKITTFPGLYLTSLPLMLINGCTVYNLRLVSLLASVLNIYLIFDIRHNNYEFKQKSTPAYSALETLTLSLLPPMYFFAHLYYTDVLSVTSILGMLLFSLRGRYQTSAAIGIFSILIRQTNIVWIGMLFGVNVLNLIVFRHLRRQNKKLEHSNLLHYDRVQLWLTIKAHLRSFRLIMESTTLIVSQFYGYIIVITGFLAFVAMNGAIVVGDKSAHEATWHLPQILYFSLFNLIFGVAMTLDNLHVIVKFIRKRWSFIVALMIVLAAIIKYNTLVHPYLLADNRHYIFYIWNRFYGRYSWAKYAMIPVYIVGLCNIHIKLKSKSFGFAALFIVCLIFSLSLQRLLEIRYFLIPFLILRLQTIKPKVNHLIFEFLCYLVINAITLYLFYTKEIVWSNYKNVQRIIW